MVRKNEYSSQIWQYCHDFNGEAPRNSKGDEVWRCKQCYEDSPRRLFELKKTNGTEGVFNHMERQHRVKVPKRKDIQNKREMRHISQITAIDDYLLAHGEKRHYDASDDSLAKRPKLKKEPGLAPILS